MGDGREEREPLATEVGQLLARLGVNLLTGGGRGVMTAVSRAYVEARPERGISIGVLPCESEAERTRPKDGYPNPWVQLPIYTHLPRGGRQGASDLSRNHLNVLTCAAIIALPGGYGTVSEVELALRYGKPLVVYAPDANTVEHFAIDAHRVETIGEVEQFLAAALARG
jgi:uncharacterized protein (TIGR00725 family)